MSDLKRYRDLQSCIDDRILNLSIRLNLDVAQVESSYVHRVNMLCIANKYLVDDYYSKFMVKAWEGTVRYYEERVQ